MIRRNSSRVLVRASSEPEEDVNPNSYISNIADCMLVVMVGLLVAFVAHYGIDLQQPQEDVTGIEVNLDTNGDGEIDEDSYEEAGKVYQDPATGQYYLVRE